MQLVNLIQSWSLSDPNQAVVVSELFHILTTAVKDQVVVSCLTHYVFYLVLQTSHRHIHLTEEVHFGRL